MLMNLESTGTSPETNDKVSEPSFAERSTRYLKRRRSRRSHRRSWSPRSRLLLGIVVVLLLFDFFGAIHLYALHQENATLRANLEQSRQELAKLQPEAKRLREDLAQLLQERLPRLKKLEYDQVIPLNDGYLKNITFTRIKDNKFNGYEYKLVLENRTVIKIWPELTVYFFNDSGIQVGASAIGGEGDKSFVPLGSLGPGQTRSYSATLAMQEGDETPAYFMIKRKQEELEEALLKNKDNDKEPGDEPQQ